MAERTYERSDHLKIVEDQLVPGEKVEGIFELKQRDKKFWGRELVLFSITNRRILVIEHNDTQSTLTSIFYSYITRLSITNMKDETSLYIYSLQENRCDIGTYMNHSLGFPQHRFLDIDGARQAHNLIVAHIH